LPENVYITRNNNTQVTIWVYSLFPSQMKPREGERCKGGFGAETWGKETIWKT